MAGDVSWGEIIYAKTYDLNSCEVFMDNFQFNFEFMIRKIGDKYVLLPIRENNFDGLVLLNESSVFLLESLQHYGFASTVNALREQYKLDEVLAADITAKFVARLKEENVIRYEV